MHATSYSLPLVRASCQATRDEVATLVNGDGTVIFEGTQDMLLDETYGFHPHTSWSSVGVCAVAAVAKDAGFDGRLFHLGVTRTYLTRHGAGPLPTHDAALNTLAEPHNCGAGWQGEFRRGHPDAVLLRYAVAATGHIDGLVTAHHDVFDQGIALQWCSAYVVDQTVVHDLPLKQPSDLAHQTALTRLLAGATPVYEPALITSSNGWCSAVERAAQRPVLFAAHGATHTSVRRTVQAPRVP